MKYLKVLLITALSLSIFGQVMARGKGATATIKLDETVEMTGIKASGKITLKSEAISAALSAGKPLEVGVIASACVYTNHREGDYDIVVNSATAQYRSGRVFAMYSRDLRKKVKVDVFVTSSNSKKPQAITPGRAAHLTNHSDVYAQGMRCSNKLLFNVSIPSNSLRTAQAGEYNFAFSSSVSDFRG